MPGLWRDTLLTGKKLSHIQDKYEDKLFLFSERVLRDEGGRQEDGSMHGPLEVLRGQFLHLPHPPGEQNLIAIII